MGRGALCHLLFLPREHLALENANATIAAMSFQAEHSYRFDAQGKLDADDWLLIPRAHLRSDVQLDAAFADELVQRYFEMVKRTSPFINILRDMQGVRYLTPLNKTAMLFAEPERIVDARRVETSWRIAGGFMLAHNVSYGGRFYLGAEWQSHDVLRIYSTIRRYPPRLMNWFGIARASAIYPRTQGWLHRRIGDLYLQAAAARLTQNPF